MSSINVSTEWGGSNIDALQNGSCIVCTAQYTDFGNNAEPFYDGQCCNRCYDTRINPMRETALITAMLGPTAVLRGDAMLRALCSDVRPPTPSTSVVGSPDRIASAASPLYSPGTPSSGSMEPMSPPQYRVSDIGLPLTTAQSSVPSTPRRSNLLSSPPSIRRVQRTPIARGSPLAHPIFSAASSADTSSDSIELESLRNDLAIARDQLEKSNKALAEALVRLDGAKRRRSSE
jgi:hypothetical protein